MLFSTRFGWFLGLLATLAGTSPAHSQRYLAAPQATTPLAPGAVAITRVVDARFQRLGTGQFVPVGALLPMPATFETEFASTLQAFFDRYAPGEPGARPLLLRVTGLDVAATRGQTARAGLVADLYAAQPDGTYRQVQHLATGSEQSSGFGLLGTPHAANLGALLLKVAATSRAQAEWLAAGPVQPAAYVEDPAPHPAEQLPVLAAETVPRPGYYHSLPEFWANAPSEPGVPDLDSRPYLGTEWAGDLEIKAYRRGPDGQRVPATDVWGFCDGHDFYLHRGGDFYRLRREGVGFTFRGRVGEGPALHTAHAALNALMLTSLASGGVGALGGGMAERPAIMNLDVLTGAVTLAATTGGSNFAARPTQLYLYRPRTAKGAAVRVQLAGEETARELAAGDYLSFTLPDSQPVQVCLLPADGPAVCLPVAPTPEATTYLEYRPDPAAFLQPVPIKTGEAALRRLVR